MLSHDWVQMYTLLKITFIKDLLPFCQKFEKE